MMTKALGGEGPVHMAKSLVLFLTCLHVCQLWILSHGFRGSSSCSRPAIFSKHIDTFCAKSAYFLKVRKAEELLASSCSYWAVFRIEGVRRHLPDLMNWFKSAESLPVPL